MIEAFHPITAFTDQAVLFRYPERSLLFSLVMDMMLSRNEVPDDNIFVEMTSFSNEDSDGNAMEVEAETTVGNATMNTSLYQTCQYFVQMCCSGAQWIQRNVIMKARNLAFPCAP